MRRVLWLTLLVHSIFLASGTMAATKSIGGDQANIRSGPSLKSHILFKAPLGYPIQVEKESGKWVCFRDWEGQKGWVYRPLVSKVKTVVILTQNANVRRAPGTTHEVVTRASRGEIYKLLQKQGQWLEIGYYHGGEMIGWIRSDLVFGE